MSGLIMFAVRAKPNGHPPMYVLVLCPDREAAKNSAKAARLPGNPDGWDVVPITEPDAKVRVFLNFTVNPGA